MHTREICISVTQKPADLILYGVLLSLRARKTKRRSEPRVVRKPIPSYIYAHASEIHKRVKRVETVITRPWRFLFQKESSHTRVRAFDIIAADFSSFDPVTENR